MLSKGEERVALFQCIRLAATVTAAATPSAACAVTAAALTMQHRGRRPPRLSKDAGQAVVALPRGAAKHQGIAAAQQQRCGRVILAGCAHEKDGVAAQAEADQRVGQAALRVVNVPIQGVACTQGG